MTTSVLGISAFYHDAAAALVRDGVIVAAAQEERFTRKKHDPRFPRNAINYCLEQAELETRDLTAVVFYDNPVLTLDRIVKTLIATAPRSEAQWLAAGRSMLGAKLCVRRLVQDMLGYAGDVLFAEHHASHAASAFYPSPFEHAAIITLDGVGEWATTTIGQGQGDTVELVAQLDFPHSIGLLYSAFTAFCGFKVNSGEYKLMGLAPYGRPVYADKILETLVDLKADGSLRVATEYFGYVEGTAMTNERFAALFGGPARAAESRITRREMDLAASIQQVTEQVVLRLARHARSQTQARHCVLAGGVALNCVANGVLLREGVFDDLWIQPAAGDAGGALGSALLASHMQLGVPRARHPRGRDMQRGSYLGPAYSSAEVRAFLDKNGYPYERVPDTRKRNAIVAQAIADGKVVGFHAGRMEFGPRALGARSILGDPRRPETQVTMNLKIKYRESFRPFAPMVAADKCTQYFELDRESPYMLLVAPVRGASRTDTSIALDDAGDDMLRLVRERRSDIPAVTHVDGSARVQTVSPDDAPEIHDLLQQFEALTGCGVLVNTSFNVRGEPIVCSPQDSYRCFMRTEMDLLVLEDCVLHKGEQPPAPDDGWRQEYELD